jgi:hypothetical protein
LSLDPAVPSAGSRLTVNIGSFSVRLAAFLREIGLARSQASYHRIYRTFQAADSASANVGKNMRQKDNAAEWVLEQAQPGRSGARLPESSVRRLKQIPPLKARVGKRR